MSHFRPFRFIVALCSLASLSCAAPEDIDNDSDGMAADSGDDGADDSAPPPAGCVPGQTVPCSCMDGSPGAQTCNADGMTYAACACDGGGGAEGGVDDAADDSGADDSGADDSGADDSGADDGIGESGEGACAQPVSFTSTVVPILYASCGAGVMGCHNRDVFNAQIEAGCRGWVALENSAIGSQYYSGPNLGNPTQCPDMPLHERLVELVPWHCEGDDYPSVVPGDPDNSYLWKKIVGGPFCGMDAIMPPPESEYELSADDAESIRCWIEQGALEN